MKGRITFGYPDDTKDVIVRLQGEIWSIQGQSTQGMDILERIKIEYLNKGVALFEKLDGSFSLVIEDHQKMKLFLVRDKLGTIPLYHAKKRCTFTWGNLISDILSDLEIETSANHDVIHEYLVFRYVSGRNTLFQGIHELLPAHYLEVDLRKGEVEEKQYWDIPYPCKSEMIKDNDETCVDKIEEILIRILKRTLSKNCRYGIMLSGGLDSSLIAALASKHVNHGFPTFFIGFTDYESDRSHDAQMVAETYHMIHSNFYVNSKQYAEGLIEAIRTNEEPLNHPGHVGRVLFDSHTKDKVDALLMGEGVDTMFCGAKAYPLLKYGYMFNPFRKLTRRIFSLIDPEIIPDSHKRYYTKIRDAFVMNADEYMIRTFAAAEFQEASDLLELEADMSYLNYYKSFISECTRENVLEKYLMLNQHTFIVEVLNSDAKYRELNQIINYYPFLDVELLSFSNHIPFKIRTKGFTGKYLIKKLAERYFSKHFIYQQKEGFGVPLKTYFQDPESMGRYFDLLLEKRTMERGIFKRRELSNFVEGFRKGEMPSESYESLLWTAINLELWYRIFIDRNGV